MREMTVVALHARLTEEDEMRPTSVLWLPIRWL